MVDVGTPVFSFGELLVLLDVDGVGPMTAPLPTPAEAAGLAADGLRGTAPCVEFHGALRFRTGLAHLYEPPRTELVVSPGHVMLTITRFPDEDIWTNMFEWVGVHLDADGARRTTIGDALALGRGHAALFVADTGRLALVFRADCAPLLSIRL